MVHFKKTNKKTATYSDRFTYLETLSMDSY